MDGLPGSQWFKITHWNVAHPPSELNGNAISDDFQGSLGNICDWYTIHFVLQRCVQLCYVLLNGFNQPVHSYRI